MVEHRKIKCPLCNNAELESTYFPPVKRERKSALSGKGYFEVSNERFIINMDKCPNCHKTKKEIEKCLKYGKPVSKEDIIKRAQEAGLPLRF